MQNCLHRRQLIFMKSDLFSGKNKKKKNQQIVVCWNFYPACNVVTYPPEANSSIESV